MQGVRKNAANSTTECLGVDINRNFADASPGKYLKIPFQ